MGTSLHLQPTPTSIHDPMLHNAHHPYLRRPPAPTLGHLGSHTPTLASHLFPHCNLQHVFVLSPTAICGVRTLRSHLHPHARNTIIRARRSPGPALAVEGGDGSGPSNLIYRLHLMSSTLYVIHTCIQSLLLFYMYSRRSPASTRLWRLREATGRAWTARQPTPLDGRAATGASRGPAPRRCAWALVEVRTRAAYRTGPNSCWDRFLLGHFLLTHAHTHTHMLPSGRAGC